MIASLANQRHVHFVGIGGIGMSALARFLLARGYTVTGSDRDPGEQAEALRRLGACVTSGHDARNVGSADLVVVTAAVGPDNPELKDATIRGIPVMKRAELLASVMETGRGIAVAGTHGKTTTSALIAHILTECGLDPTVLIGGISLNLGSNARVGGSDFVVVEADEYDASFLRLRPEIAVITNAESEHLDFYGSPEAMFGAYETFIGGVSGTLVACADDPALARMMQRAVVPIVTYGYDRGDWSIRQVQEQNQRTSFVAAYGPLVQDFTMQLAGHHNVRNATAAIAVAHLLHVPLNNVARAVSTFAGVGRRLETKGEAAGVLVLDDYAHHPTEIRVNLSAVRERFKRPIRLVFQPHTFSRTRDFLDDFAIALGEADHVYLLDIYASRETDSLGISGSDLAVRAGEHHRHVKYTESMETTLEALLIDARSGDLVLTMGAGDVHMVGEKLLMRLRSQ